MFDDDFFDDFERWFFGSREPQEDVEISNYQLTYDVWEENGKIFVTVELPGVEEKDIELQISGNRLLIRSYRRKGSSDVQEGYYKTIRLPYWVKEKPISKTFKNGVLELIFEKANGERQRIEVR
ncbi:MAG: Hsp20/alpha crystallin family protein [Candidatus Diapherotrites archaeon]